MRGMIFIFKFIGLEIFIFVIWYTHYLHFYSDGVRYLKEIDFNASRYTFILLFIINIIFFLKALINLLKNKTFDKVSIYWQFLLLIFNFCVLYLQARFSFIYIIITVFYYFLMMNILYSNNEGLDLFKSSLSVSNYNKIQKFFFWISNIIYICIYYVFYFLSYNFIEDNLSNLGAASLVKYIGGILFSAFMLISFVQENYQLDDSN